MINYHHIDNMEFMLNVPDKHYKWAIVDPEWGRKQHGGVNRSHNSLQKNGSKMFVKAPNHKKKGWDNKPAGKEYFDELLRISQNQIIWGVNYYNYVFGPGRIIWDKCNQGSDQSDCEIAYNSNTNRIDQFRYMWRGFMQGKSIKEGHIQQGNKKLNEKIIHPTQKPVNLYLWTIKKYIKLGDNIFDSHLGSGSIGIACDILGFNLDACENDIDTYLSAKNRLNSHIQLKKQAPTFSYD